MLPAWLYVTEQVPVPLVMVMVAELLPLPEHAPEPAIVTGLPEAPPVAVTEKLVLYVALARACRVTMIV